MIFDVIALPDKHSDHLKASRENDYEFHPLRFQAWLTLAITCQQRAAGKERQRAQWFYGGGSGAWLCWTASFCFAQWIAI
jgi:hypothetical protein